MVMVVVVVVVVVVVNWCFHFEFRTFSRLGACHLRLLTVHYAGGGDEENDLSAKDEQGSGVNQTGWGICAWMTVSVRHPVGGLRRVSLLPYRSIPDSILPGFGLRV